VTVTDGRRGPLVSIGCAVYNGEATLRRALEPLVEQTYPNIEIIVSDDCSKDGSPAIIAEFARRDSRIRVLSNEKNVGVTQNFNKLARSARGKYFMWADQDDIRDRTFIEKTIGPLEADPEAVICHSHTGVFFGDPENVKYIITLGAVAGIESLPRRYLSFLTHYSDTVLYGLLRTEALHSTRLYRNDLGSANALLFELLLRGKFLEVPEVLYFYSGRGVRNRPSVREEYARANPGKEMPRFYFPSLVLAKNQTEDIRRSPLGLVEKVELASVLWGHASAIGLTKLLYRGLAKPLGKRVPESVTLFCDGIVEPKSHLRFLNGSEKDEYLFPKGWAVKGGE